MAAIIKNAPFGKFYYFIRSSYGARFFNLIACEYSSNVDGA